MCVCADSDLSPVQRVDQALQQNDGGVESALLYAKAWSKYAKDVLAWVEKRLGLGESSLKTFIGKSRSQTEALNHKTHNIQMHYTEVCGWVGVPSQ